MTSNRRLSSLVLAPLVIFGLLVAALADAAPAEAQHHHHHYRAQPRTRLGIQGDIGYVRESNSGIVLGVTGQIGVQQNDLFAVFYQPRLLAGSFFDGDNSATVIAFYNTLMFDFTIADMVQFGLGPSLDLGVAGVCGRTTCEGFGGAFFGADFKAGLVFGGDRRYPSRSGFLLALHVHPTWLARSNNPVTTVTLGFGYQVY